MLSIPLISSTEVTTWSGVDYTQLGPIYPMVGSEFLLFILGLIFWIGFHFLQSRIESREMKADADAAKSAERLKRVFADEAKE